jgi:Putative prokaryotic signal transducing protein
VEIIDRGNDSGEDLVQIAFADSREEAGLISGLLREEGIRCLARQASLETGARMAGGFMTRSPRRIYVHPTHAAAARKLLGEIMVEDPLESEIPEPANAAHLADATGHKPRDYSLAGGWARILLTVFAVLAIVFVVFLVAH